MSLVFEDFKNFVINSVSVFSTSTRLYILNPANIRVRIQTWDFDLTGQDVVQ